MGIKRTQLVAVTALTGTAAQIYVAPSLTWAQITAATVLNPTGASVTVKVYLVPAAGTAAVANQVVQKTLLAGSRHRLLSFWGRLCWQVPKSRQRAIRSISRFLVWSLPSDYGGAVS